MLLAIGAVLVGFVFVIWSAGRFVDGAAAIARYANMPPLLIGMLIIGFGTSAPEMIVSTIAALEGKPELAIGNAIGSNIVNTGLILAITALIAPIVVHSTIIRKELPVLLVITLLVGGLFWDNNLSGLDAAILLSLFATLILWSIFTASRAQDEELDAQVTGTLDKRAITLRAALFWLLVGLLVLLASSRLLVWGAIDIATGLGVSELIIGLTIIALGTSLPELAASVIAARRQEHDLAVGNIIGSNMFNLLAVVGIAGGIAPIEHISGEIMLRDWPVLMALTFILFVMVFRRRGAGEINRIEGAILLLIYLAYTWVLVASTL